MHFLCKNTIEQPWVNVSIVAEMENKTKESSNLNITRNYPLCGLTSVGLLNFSLGYTKLVTPKGKNQHTLRKL